MSSAKPACCRLCGKTFPEDGLQDGLCALCTSSSAPGNSSTADEVPTADSDKFPAEQLFRRLLAIREKTPDAINPSLTATLEGYAAVLRKLGRADEADKLDAQNRTVREKAAKEALRK